MNTTSLSHSDSGSEIPDGLHTENDATEVVTKVLSNTERVMECLSEAAGESLTVEEIADATGLTEKAIKRVLTKALAEDAETREVFEDENSEGSYFLTEALLDRLAV